MTLFWDSIWKVAIFVVYFGGLAIVGTVWLRYAPRVFEGLYDFDEVKKGFLIGILVVLMWSALAFGVWNLINERTETVQIASSYGLKSVKDEGIDMFAALVDAEEIKVNKTLKVIMAGKTRKLRIEKILINPDGGRIIYAKLNSVALYLEGQGQELVDIAVDKAAMLSVVSLE